MCCFKRLAVKTKRKAGWARGERTSSVSRPSNDEIKRKKRARMKPWDRKALEKAEVAKAEKLKQEEFFQQKGWTT